MVVGQTCNLIKGGVTNLGLSLLQYTQITDMKPTSYLKIKVYQLPD